MYVCYIPLLYKPVEIHVHIEVFILKCVCMYWYVMYVYMYICMYVCMYVSMYVIPSAVTQYIAVVQLQHSVC